MGLITKENKICYIMGGFNFNLMNHQSHQLTAEFLDVMFGYRFFFFNNASYKTYVTYWNDYR